MPLDALIVIRAFYFDYGDLSVGGRPYRREAQVAKVIRLRVGQLSRSLPFIPPLWDSSSVLHQTSEIRNEMIQRWPILLLLCWAGACCALQNSTSQEETLLDEVELTPLLQGEDHSQSVDIKGNIFPLNWHCF